MGSGLPVDWSLYLVADVENAAGRDLVALVERAVEGGVTAVQLRAKPLGTREFLDLALRLASVLEPRSVPLIVNDRTDIALACGAEGVHLGQDDMPPGEARRLIGGKRLIGVSVNSVEEARRAEVSGADYLGLGPVYATSTKETALPLLGPEGIRRIGREVGIPVIAIGGVTAANAPDVIEAGADGVAVVSAILGADDVRAAAAAMMSAVRLGRLTRRGS